LAVKARSCRLSVCMATYNGSPYLREQVESILPQLGPEDELIISDDQSTDNTLSILASYTDPRIRLIANPGKRGHVQNFAHAIEQAAGEFIALSDQDDIWVENRLERMLGQLRQLPRYSLVIGDFTEFTSCGVATTQTKLGSSPRSQLAQLAGIFLGRFKYFGSGFLFRSDLMRYILPIPSYIEAHDIWIAMNATIHGRAAHFEETTLLRRLHGNNLSPRHHRRLPTVAWSRVLYLVGLLQSSIR
jgi:glycosyltransferase involved in cell wall biosynthesis